MADKFLENFLENIGSVPGIRIDREEFLRKTFGKRYFKKKHVDKIVLNGPLDAGLSLETVSRMADEAIRAEAAKTIILSAATGAPGGVAGWATIPLDIAQFYTHSFRVIQKLMYLYGWQENIFDGDGNMDDATTHAVVLYLGVMFGVGMAGKVLANLTKTTSKKMVWIVSKKTIGKFIKNKTFRKIVLKIMELIGVKTSAQIALKVPGKAIPVIGSVISGFFTATFFVPASGRLKKFFEKGELFRLESEELDSEEEDEFDIEGLVSEE